MLFQDLLCTDLAIRNHDNTVYLMCKFHIMRDYDDRKSKLPV